MTASKWWISPAVVATVLTLAPQSSVLAKEPPKISVADDPSIKEGSPTLVLVEVSDFL